MEDGRALGARDLILAVFRHAVADYLGTWYGHDEPAPHKHGNTRFRADAVEFLRSRWAEYLADGAGVTASAIWLEALRLASLEERQVGAA